jgi:hypothetical protein
MKWAAFALILGSTAVAADSCTPAVTETTCADGKGTWISDESDSLKGGYTVIVRLCVDDGGNVLDMEVD